MMITWTPEQKRLMDEMEVRLFKEAHPDQQRQPLFHYTNAERFRGIIASGDIWATHFEHMNDRAELRLGEEVVLEEAQRLVRELPVDTPRRYIVDEFTRLHPRARLTETANVYLASFSEQGDLLSQWRAYGSDGSGYAIGFRSLPLPIGDRPEAQAGLMLVKCEYDPSAFRRRSRDILLEVAQGFEDFWTAHADTSEAGRAIPRGALNIGFRRIAAEIPRLKNKAFIEEQEWRLVVIPMSDREQEITKFRAGRTLRPYVEVGLAQPNELLDLEAVVVGPSQDAALAARAAEMLLNHRGYRDGLVRSSSAPYRGAAG
jgi:hypothetical protein